MENIESFDEFINKDSKSIHVRYQDDDYSIMDKTFMDIDLSNIPYEELKKQYVYFKSIKENNKKVDDKFKKIDLKNIPFDKLKKQYVNFRSLVKSPPTYGDFLFDPSKKRILKEGIKYSLDINKVIHEISKKYGLDDWQYEIEKMENDISVALIVPHIYQNENLIIEDMTCMGYFEMNRWTINVNDLIYTVIRFDPRYPKSITNDVHNMRIIYHYSPKYNLSSIQENGFVPQHKNKKFTYPPRLHFLKGDIDNKNLYNIGKQLCDNNDDVRNTGEYILFTLDTDRIPDNVEFIGDSCYEFGICTEDKIPYDCVLSIKEEKFK